MKKSLILIVLGLTAVLSQSLHAACQGMRPAGNWVRVAYADGVCTFTRQLNGCDGAWVSVECDPCGDSIPDTKYSSGWLDGNGLPECDSTFTYGDDACQATNTTNICY